MSLASARSKSKNEERLKMTNQRDDLNSQRLQAENAMSAKKLALSEATNRQASSNQAQDKVKELEATETTLAGEIEVRSLLCSRGLD